MSHLQSVLQQTTGIHKDGDLLASLQEEHAMANSATAQKLHQAPPNNYVLKKQGVSAESSDTSHQLGEISVVKHEKDFRLKIFIRVLDREWN